MICTLTKHTLYTLYKSKPKQQNLAAFGDAFLHPLYRAPYTVRDVALHRNNTQCQCSKVNSRKSGWQNNSYGNHHSHLSTFTFRPLKQRLVVSTHRFDDSDGAQLWIAATPHPPVVVLALLQKVLVSSIALLLIAHPAAGTEVQHGESSSLNQIYASGGIWKARRSVEIRILKKEKRCKCSYCLSTTIHLMKVYLKKQQHVLCILFTYLQLTFHVCNPFSPDDIMKTLKHKPYKNRNVLHTFTSNSVFLLHIYWLRNWE